ncbi:MAG: SUMF1/EgtB/PvdO family nonheme iron enzyme [Chthoniobacter sp.]|nr:SUMF1/EgtB/PvdO family nonheme iron enzyme [Chthoniobacter sp.]
MAKLHHPNIVTVFDFGTTCEGYLFFVMEYVAGANLADVIHQVGLNDDQALSVAEQVCTALAYAHGKGIVHRDIKPANVMIDTESHVKVADFGLARLTEPSAERMGTTGTGVVLGTPDYMAPEQTQGMNVDHLADIYSLGVMLYEMLCRQVPKGIFQPPSARVGCDARIDDIVIRAMQQAPEHRYQSTQEMKADVTAARTPVPDAPAVPTQIVHPHSAAQPAGLASPNAVPVQALSPTAKKRARLPLYSALVIGVAAVGAGVTFFGKATPQVAPILTPAVATKDRPFVNSLGMKFVPVPITGGPTDGQRVLFSMWETRVQDYQLFAKETQHELPTLGFEQGPTHPAVLVSWDDAQAFCSWLTQRERTAGKLNPTERYRLPSDHEWSCAVGIGNREEAAAMPAWKHDGVAGVYPLGSAWPPPAGGNYLGEERTGVADAWRFPKTGTVIAGYRDAYVGTAPVGSFQANSLGIYDLGGNVWEFCEDYLRTDNSRPEDSGKRVVRGASWHDYGEIHIRSSGRTAHRSQELWEWVGFRCVVDSSSSQTTAPAAATPPAKR